ncbi:putative uncharacterized protein [Methanobrevibacter smithii CAG:186]|uniref:Uncharacterized protein n=1 Tax=Methanobrevibacter smithii CAG:186 TaxID=1263088 RepID=R7PVX3_METSM|nr:hypothetical protein [Methanobrevibacter smithii]CDF28697.1 putative uncharacterized protein [Methanobrevibacter smithii CAG:186]
MYVQDSKIEEYYSELKEYHEKYLKQYGVKLPRLKNNGKFAKGALTLIYLYINFKKPVTKEELTDFVGQYHERQNDLQQARHFGQQSGWFIITGTRGDLECEEYNVKSGEYALISVKDYYPGFTNEKRIDNLSGEDWESIKEQYNKRCATCGSIEGESNIHYPNVITKLQKGHKNPNKPLEYGNIIPQCDQCNRQDRNNFIYNDKGRVIKIANPKFILRSDKKTKELMYELLKRELNKK